MSENEIPIPEPTPAVAQEPQEQVVAEEPARLGPFARLTGVLLSPGEAFADVNRKPTWLAPTIIAVIVTVAFSFFFEWKAKPDWDKFFQAAVEKRLGKPLKDLPPEQQESVKKQLDIQKMFARTDIKSPLSIFIVFARTIVFYAIAFLIVSGIFALGLMLMQAQTTFKKILSVVAWSWCATGLIYTIVMVASLMVRDSESLKDINLADPAGIVPSNLAVILSSDTSPPLRSIAASLDIFTIWYLVILSIGFAMIAGARKFKTQKAAVLVFGLWAVWVLVKTGAAAMGLGGR